MATTTAADGTTLAYDDLAPAGDADGPAVVLVHGITENRRGWDPIVDRLGDSHRIVRLDLRGHGESGMADRYDLEAMTGDVVAVCTATGLERPHLVGHSLGGVLVSAAGAAMPVTSVVNVDQPLKLEEFGDQVRAFEPQLRDPDTFPVVMGAIFEQMAGMLAGTDEFARITESRRPVQEVVLGVWDLLMTSPPEEVAASVDAALAAYASVDVPYLSLFGIDPGDGYDGWLASKIDGAVTEIWADHGHYPHLVDPDRFVERLEGFWSS